MAEIVDTEILARTGDYVIERRRIRLGDGSVIVRDVLDDHRELIAVLPRDQQGRLVFRSGLHAGNAMPYWGIPSRFAEAGGDSIAAAAALVNDTFPAPAEDVVHLMDLTEDATAVAGRRVRYFLAAVDDVDTTGYWSVPAETAIEAFRLGALTDSMTMAGLLWLRAGDDAGVGRATGVTPPALPPGPGYADREVHRSRRFTIVERMTDPPGTTFDPREVVLRDDTVLVLPVRDGELLVLHEYLAGVNAHPPGLVGGHARRTGDPAAIAAEAEREMREECGLGGRLTHLATTLGSPDQRRLVHHFLATDVYPDALGTGDEDHDLSATWEPVARLAPQDLPAALVVSEAVTALLVADQLRRDHPSGPGAGA